MESKEEECYRSAQDNGTVKTEAGDIPGLFRIPCAEGTCNDGAAAYTDHGSQGHDDTEHRADDGHGSDLGRIAQLCNKEHVSHVVENHDDYGQKSRNGHGKNGLPDGLLAEKFFVSAAFTCHRLPPQFH